MMTNNNRSNNNRSIEDIEEQEIVKGIAVDRKPDKYPVSQNKITLVSNASKEIKRNGYSFLGWVKTNEEATDLSNKDNKYNLGNSVYVIPEEEKSKTLYFVASWSKNNFKFTKIKFTILNSGSENPGDTTENIFDANDNDDNINLKSTIKPEISIELHSNVVSGFLKIESENAIVKDVSNNVINEIRLTNSSDGTSFKILPENLGEYKVTFRCPPNDIYFDKDLVLSGEYTLPYKKLIFNDINIDSNRAFDGTFSKNVNQKEWINFNTNFGKKDFNILTSNISNNDNTGRTLRGYKNSLYIEDTTDTHLIETNNDNLRMNVLGNPDSNGEINLYPIYDLIDYNIKYLLEEKEISFDDNNVAFPNTYNADNPKVIGDLIGLDSYYKLENGKYVLTNEPDINTIYIKDTNIKTTIPTLPNPYSNLNVALIGSYAYPYKVYNSLNLEYKGEPPILVETGKDAISNTEEVSRENVFFIKDRSSIILEPPANNSVTYEDDNENFVFVGYYESKNKEFIAKDEVSGNCTYNVKSSDNSELSFYAVWEFQELIEAYVNNDNNIESIIIE